MQGQTVFNCFSLFADTVGPNIDITASGVGKKVFLSNKFFKIPMRSYNDMLLNILLAKLLYYTIRMILQGAKPCVYPAAITYKLIIKFTLQKLCS